MWRLVFSDYGNFTYQKVFYEMSPEEIHRANLALDRYLDEVEAQRKRSRK